MATKHDFEERTGSLIRAFGRKSSNRWSGLQRVRPGDLITADFANSLVDAILLLEHRLAALESMDRGPFEIGQIDVGYGDFAFMFDVTGSGLDPAGLQSFSFDDEEFEPEDLTGTDSHIRFAVRTLGALRVPQPSTGLSASARVALNDRTKDKMNDFIMSRGGSIDFNLQIENVAGAVAQLEFSLSRLA